MFFWGSPSGLALNSSSSPTSPSSLPSDLGTQLVWLLSSLLVVPSRHLLLLWFLLQGWLGWYHPSWQEFAHHEWDCSEFLELVFWVPSSWVLHTLHCRHFSLLFSSPPFTCCVSPVACFLGSFVKKVVITGWLASLSLGYCGNIDSSLSVFRLSSLCSFLAYAFFRCLALAVGFIDIGLAWCVESLDTRGESIGCIVTMLESSCFFLTSMSYIILSATVKKFKLHINTPDNDKSTSNTIIVGNNKISSSNWLLQLQIDSQDNNRTYHVQKKI